MAEHKIHFNYEDKEVKLDFSFPCDDKKKCIEQMVRFRGLLEKAVQDITPEIAKLENEVRNQ